MFLKLNDNFVVAGTMLNIKTHKDNFCEIYSNSCSQTIDKLTWTLDLPASKCRTVS